MKWNKKTQMTTKQGKLIAEYPNQKSAWMDGWNFDRRGEWAWMGDKKGVNVTYEK